MSGRQPGTSEGELKIKLGEGFAIIDDGPPSRLAGRN